MLTFISFITVTKDIFQYTCTPVITTNRKYLRSITGKIQTATNVGLYDCHCLLSEHVHVNVITYIDPYMYKHKVTPNPYQRVL